MLLDEAEGGIITRYAIFDGNPPDAPNLPASLAHHQTGFGHVPDLLAADRGFWSAEAEQEPQAMGICRVAIPHRGGKPPSHLRERWFRRGHRFRSGIKGRISVLRRRLGLDRCRYHGHDGMEYWVGLGILAHNLRTISRSVAAKQTW